VFAWLHARPQTYINTLRAAEAELAALPGGGRTAGKQHRRGIGEGAGGDGADSSDDEDDDDEGAQGGDAAAPCGEGKAGADNEAVWAGGDLKVRACCWCRLVCRPAEAGCADCPWPCVSHNLCDCCPCLQMEQAEEAGADGNGDDRAAVGQDASAGAAGLQARLVVSDFSHASNDAAACTDVSVCVPAAC
jgi:hypothetical protein